jgi:hypothetical protein
MDDRSVGLQSNAFLNLRLLLLENAKKDKTSSNNCNIVQKNISLGNYFILMGCKAVTPYNQFLAI